MSLSSFSVRRGVTTMMIFVAVLVLGAVSFTRLSLDMFPDIEMPTVSVITFYPGASATDVEEKVTDIIEEVLAVTPHVEDMSSISTENLSAVTLQFSWGTNLDEAMNDIRARLDFATRHLPEDAESPVLFRLDFGMLPVVMIGVTTDQGSVHEYSSYIEDRIANRIERLEGVASVQAMNARDPQVLVEVDRQRLEDHGLSLRQLATVIRMENLTLPAGSMELGRSVYAIRVPGEYATIDELRDVIVSQHQGAVVRLRDVAEIREDFEEVDSVALLNGSPMLFLMVRRESGANTVEVARRVNQLVEELDRDIPEHLHVVPLMDMSVFIVDMIDHLTSAVLVGGVLVILVAFLFLRRLRTTLIVALSIPTCLVAVFAMLWIGGYTINMISLASIALAIGIVVDNGIVVVENITRHVDQGKSAMQAAVAGAEEVGGAVMASSLTNIAIFAPIVFVGGLIGIIFNQLAFVIIVAIVLSLLVALMLAPMLASRLLRGRATAESGWLHQLLGRPMQALERAYERVIARVVATRAASWLVIVVAITAFLGSTLLVRFIGQDYMPNMDSGTLLINLELPTGTRTEHTLEVAQQIEGIIKRRVPEAELTFIQAGRGKQGMGTAMGGRQGSNVAMVGCSVPSLSERSRTTFDMADAIRPEIEQIPGIVSLEIQAGSMLTKMSSAGARPVTVEVYGDDAEVARRAAVAVRDLVSRIPGTTDVTTDMVDDVPELRVSIDRQRAARVGVPMAGIAMAVRTGFHGHAVTRFRGGDQDIDIFVRLAESDRQSVDALRQVTVPSLAKAQIRLGNVADVTEDWTPVEIRRLDGDRVVRVMANVSDRPIGDVARDLEQSLAAARSSGEIPEEMETRITGDIQEQRNMVADLSIALLLAILLVYMVMAALFESYLDPLVIMFSVPFGISGVFVALVLTGTSLALTSFLGMIIMVGIVVNNAIVLVDYINEMRRQGMGLREAVTTGGSRRLRPVLMTSLTTMGGMLPLALATGEGSEMWRPMGLAVIGGLLVSMLVTLVLIPAIYMATDRWRRVKGLKQEEPSAEKATT